MRQLFLFLALLSSTIVFAQKPKKEFGFKVFYGPQVNFFKLYEWPFTNVKTFGIQKKPLGFCYGIDAEMTSKNKKWIFGIGYSYNQNKKKYFDGEGEQFQDGYSVDIVLRNIERTLVLYADRKVNHNNKNSLYAGLGILFSQPEDQTIDIFYEPGELHGALINGAPQGYNSIEGGIAGRFRWQHNWNENVQFGAELKVHFLYSIGELTKTCLVPYLKVNF